MELFAWRDGLEDPAPTLVGKLKLGEQGIQLADGSDAALRTALGTLVAEPYLPLTVREEVDGRRFVRCERVTPGQPGYWAALADGLVRQTGLVITTDDKPPA